MIIKNKILTLKRNRNHVVKNVSYFEDLKTEMQLDYLKSWIKHKDLEAELGLIRERRANEG